MEASVDLTFIIFKAAILLKHIGGHNSQCIEYLDYLVEDPPVNDGYTKSHVLAFQTLVYEHCGNEYEVLLKRSYQQLLETYNSEMSAGRKPITNQRKLDNIVNSKGFDKSSEIWEVFALQALERSEYVLAAEFLTEAVRKAPNKGKLHHVLAEILFVLNETQQSLQSAERAYTLQPGSPELRNLLITLSPDKWTDRLRVVAPTREINHRDIDTENLQINYDEETVKKKSSNPSATADSSWLASMRGTLKVSQSAFLF
jgi:tetratricopeptide (TPR) repeat protein